MPACLAVVVKLKVVFAFSAPGPSRRQGRNINWLELRAAQYPLLELASPGDVVQLHGYCLHKENGRHPLPVTVQGEPSVVVTGHQEKHHHSCPSVAFHIGEHRGGFPQQTQTAEVGLQTDLISVLEDLPRISKLAHTGCLHVQGDSSDSQVDDLGAALQGNGNQCP